MKPKRIDSDEGDKQKTAESAVTTEIKAARADEQYLEITAGDEFKEKPIQSRVTCESCGLTARNNQELRDHIIYAHK
jgi:hypothetical protein